jgi:cytoskeleton protein RodZ
VTDPAVRDSDAASGLGSMLRRAREALGLTEQDAAERLNLDVSVVSALEREDFAALGAPVFAKGHLRRYGDLLGIPEQSALDAYQRAQGQPETPSLIPRARLEMMPARSRPRWSLVLGGAAAFVLAAGITAYVSEFGLRLPSMADDGVPTAQEGTVAAGQSAPVEDTGTTTSPAAGDSVASAPEGSASTLPTPAPVVPVPPGHVSVTLAFATDSWTEIYDGSGKAVLYDLGRAGTQRTIAAAAPLSVTFGNSPGVTLHVNGRPAAMPPPPSGGTVARFRIEADGTLR